MNKYRAVSTIILDLELKSKTCILPVRTYVHCDLQVP